MVKNLTFDLTCGAISDFQMKFCKIYGKFMPSTIECRFQIANRYGSLADSAGGRNSPVVGKQDLRMFRDRKGSQEGAEYSEDAKQGMLTRRCQVVAGCSVSQELSGHNSVERAGGRRAARRER